MTKTLAQFTTRNQLLSICSLDLYEFDLYEGFLERIIRINRGMSVHVLVLLFRQFSLGRLLMSMLKAKRSKSVCLVLSFWRIYKGNPRVACNDILTLIT